MAKPSTTAPRKSPMKNASMISMTAVPISIILNLLVNVDAAELFKPVAELVKYL